MERLTIDGNFCDIAQCTDFECAATKEVSCDPRRVYERLREYEDAEQEGRVVVLPSIADDIDAPLRERMRDLLEPIKVEAALNSERLKLEIRKKRDPKSVSILDYTIISALLYVLAGMGDHEEEAHHDD